MHADKYHFKDNFYEETRNGLLIHLWWHDTEHDTPKDKRLCSWIVYKDANDGRGLAWSSQRIPYSHALYNARKAADKIAERTKHERTADTF